MDRAVQDIELVTRTTRQPTQEHACSQEEGYQEKGDQEESE